MTAIYREFPLRSPSAWQALVAFVKANAAACLEKGKPLRLIVTQDEKKRTLEQNRFFHGPVLDAITQQPGLIGVTGGGGGVPERELDPLPL